MPVLVHLAAGFFTIFSDALIPKPLLLVPLTANAASIWWSPEKGHPRQMYLNEVMHKHVTVRVLVDALRLAYGCLHLGTAEDRSDVVPSFRRWAVFPVVNGVKSDVALQGADLDEPLQAGQGVFLSVYTNNGGIRVPINFTQVPQKFSDLLHHALAATGGVTAPGPSTFAANALNDAQDAPCRFLGDEPIIHAIHVFDKRWSEPLLRELATITRAMADTFDESLTWLLTTDTGFTLQYNATPYQRAFASIEQPILGFDLEEPLMDQSANAALSSPTCHALLDSTKLLVYCDKALFMNPVPSKTISMRARDQAGPDAPEPAPVINDIPVTDSPINMLWDVRFSVGILARYASAYLRDLLSDAKTANTTSKKRKHGDSGPLPGRGDDSSALHNGGDAEDDGTNLRKRQKGAEDAPQDLCIASNSQDSVGKQSDGSDSSLVQEPPKVVGTDTKNGTAAEPIMLSDGTLVYDPTPAVAVLDEEGVKWCAFIIANLKAQMPASVDMGAEKSPSAPREVSWY